MKEFETFTSPVPPQGGKNETRIRNWNGVSLLEEGER